MAKRVEFILNFKPVLRFEERVLRGFEVRAETAHFGFFSWGFRDWGYISLLLIQNPDISRSRKSMCGNSASANPLTHAIMSRYVLVSKNAQVMATLLPFIKLLSSVDNKELDTLALTDFF